MKHKSDVYKKPRMRPSELITVIVSAIVLVILLAIEIYGYILHQSKAPVSTAINDENNTTQQLVQKSVVPTIEEKNESCITPKPIVIKEAIKPHIYETILRESDEKKVIGLLALQKKFTKAQANKILLKEIKAGHLESVKTLIKEGYRLDKPYSAANKLIADRHYEMAMVLLQNGMIDAKQSNPAGYTLLHEAAAKGHVGLIRLLIAKGAKINVQANDGVSVLHYPTRFAYKITVNILLKLGIDPNLQATVHYGAIDWNKSAPLHIAASRGNLDIVKRLIEGGADATLKDGRGETAYDIAMRKGFSKISALLEPKNEVKKTLHPSVEQNKTQSEPELPVTDVNQSHNQSGVDLNLSKPQADTIEHAPAIKEGELKVITPSAGNPLGLTNPQGVRN